MALSSLVRLPALHVCRCTGTLAACLPGVLRAVEGLTRLQYLGVEDSKLADLPHSSFLTRLTALSLARNSKLQSVLAGLGSSTSCRIIDLSGCPFDGPAGCIAIRDIGHFSWCSALRTLGLQPAAFGAFGNGAELRQRDQVPSALRDVLSSHCGPGESVNIVIQPDAGLDALMGRPTAPRDAFELDSGWGD